MNVELVEARTVAVVGEPNLELKLVFPLSIASLACSRRRGSSGMAGSFGLREKRARCQGEDARCVKQQTRRKARVA
jgi:hypothetical protein